MRLRHRELAPPVDRGPPSRAEPSRAVTLTGGIAPSEGRLAPAGRILGHVGRDHLFQYVEVYVLGAPEPDAIASDLRLAEFPAIGVGQVFPVLEPHEVEGNSGFV